MTSTQGHVVSAFLGAPGTLKKEQQDSLDFAIDGIVGDRHRGATRKCWDQTDKQPGGTERRNERQWSAVAQEDLAEVSERLSLATPLAAGDVAVNLSIAGVPDFSRLPRGTVLKFQGGVVLMVEEYNPPCSRMSRFVAETYLGQGGKTLSDSAFIEASKFCRGVVGVVEVPGTVAVGETVTVEPEVLPKWLRSKN
jgi:MOSC domain-containing protein YiiM